MDESDCLNFCPGLDCPPECVGFTNAMSEVVGTPFAFTGGMFQQAQQHFTDWGGVGLLASITIGMVLSSFFGR
ncbi:hypothetical protein [Coleofasciculus chthonoplastes]|nr:hypothetical protein [Coleofasciculus chthonoplastes]